MPRTCPLCEDMLTPCYITHSKDGHLAECHGMDKDFIGTSLNRSPMQPHVCAGCGYVAMFASEPEVFRHEANRSRGALPLPAVVPLNELKVDAALPLPAASEEPHHTEEMTRRES